MTDTIELPSDVHAERAVLGAMLNDPAAVDQARLGLPVDAFFDQRHAELYTLMLDLADRDLTPEPMTVVQELGRRKQLGRWDNGIAVYELWRNGETTGSNLTWHAAQIRYHARVRQAKEASARLTQRLTDGDPDLVLDAIAHASIELQLAADTPDDETVEGLTTWDEFHDAYEKGDEANWVVPGLLRRQDIMFVLAAPGVGKSFLSRQIVQCLAAGIHPFTLAKIRPVRTLLIDLENAPSQVAEENRPSFAQVQRLGGPVGDRGWIWMHQEGLNIRKADDARLLEQVIAQVRPDVVAFGSLYNAYKRGNDGWDTAAEDVQDVIKKLRKRYNLTFWVEHHMVRAQGGGHTGSPFGGTSWEKWPTHGRILQKAVHPDTGKVVSGDVYSFAPSPNFRGDRGHRELPPGLHRGGKLPWTAYEDQAEFERCAAGAA